MKKWQEFVENKNFMNNQNYVKYENADKKFYKYKVLIYLFYATIFSFLFVLIAYNIFNLIDNTIHYSSHPGIIFRQDGNYYYFNKTYANLFIVFYTSLLILFIVLSYIRYKFFKKLDKGYFNKSGKKEKFYTLKIILVIIVIMFFIFTPILSIKYFIIGFLMVFVPSIIEIFLFSKQKIYIKKPFNIKHFYYINPKNLIIQRGKKIKKSILFFTPFLILILYSFFIVFILNPKNSIGSFVSINLDNFVKNGTLDLSYKEVRYRQKWQVCEYLQKNKIKKLNLEGFESLYGFVEWCGDIFSGYKLDEVNFGDIKYYHDERDLKFIEDFDYIKKHLANKIILKFNRSGNTYYLAIKDEIRRLYYDLNENKIKNTIKIEFKNKRYYRTSLSEILNKSLLFDNFKGKIILSNVLSSKDNYWSKIDLLLFIREINNKFVIATGDYSEYINKYFSLKFGQKTDNIVVYKDKFIPSVIIENLILNYENTHRVILENIKSDNIDFKRENAFVIEPGIKVKNLILTKGTKFKIITEYEKDIKNSLNILTDNFGIKEKLGNYKTLEDILISGYLKPKVKVRKEILFKNSDIKFGYYNFSKNFLNGLYKKNIINTDFINYIYETYYEYLFNDKSISENILDEIWLKYKNNKKFKKMFDLFTSTNTKTILNISFKDQTKNNFKKAFKNLLNSKKFSEFIMDFKIFNTFNKKFYNAFIYPEGNYDLYIQSKKVGFKEIFKLGNIYIFIKNDEV